MPTLTVPAPPTGLNLTGPVYRGLLGQLEFGRVMTRDLLGALLGWRQAHGSNWSVRINDTPVVFITEPEDVHAVLVTEAARFRKSDDYTSKTQGISRFLGNGLLTSDGAFWRRQRKLAAPAFHGQRISAYAALMTRHTAAMLAGWRDGDEIDVAEAFSAVTMRIAAEALFGTAVDDATIHSVSRAVIDMQEYFAGQQLLPPWVPTPAELAARRSVRDIDAAVYGIIERRRAAGAADTGDLMSMLLAARDDEGRPMSDQELRDEVVTLLLAGHETTANSLNWTFVALAQHPEVEDRLRAEVDAVLGGRAPTLDDLPRLSYTEKVLKETLRLYPPAFAIGRQSLEPVTLSFGVVPADTMVQIPIYLIHRDPRWHPDPERYDPERFTPEREKALPRSSYLPFGGGPRICIGNAFAMLEGRLLLAQIVSGFGLRLTPRTRLTKRTGLTLNPRHGLRLRIEARA